MKNKLLPWVMWGMAAIFYFYEFALQVSPGVLAQHLIDSFNISTMTLGTFGAAYYYTYAPMQVPAGMLIDKFGPKRILSFAISCCVLAVLLFSLSSHFNYLVLSRALLGLGSAFAMVGTLKLAANWFPEDRFAFLTGLTYSIGIAGALVGKVPFTILLSHMDWPVLFRYLFFFGLVLLILFLCIIKDAPPEVQANQTKNKTPSMQDFIAVLRLPQIWLIALYSGLMLAGMLSMGALWGEQYLMQVHEFSQREAAGIVSLFFLGYGLGAPCIGKFSDKIRRRKLPLLLGAISCLFFYSALIYLPSHSMFVFSALAFCFGIGTSFSIIAFPLAKEICPEIVGGTAIAFTNFVTMSLAAGGQFLIGYILMHQASHTETVHVHSSLDFHIAFSLFCVCYVIAFMLSIFIKETYCQQH